MYNFVFKAGEAVLVGISVTQFTPLYATLNY